MKIEVGEEISLEEYDDLPNYEGISVANHYTGEFHYYKEAQKFPICFENGGIDSGFAFEVLEGGLLRVRNKATGDYFLLGKEEIELFNKAKEVSNGK